ncbi:MAG: hypothetical protein AAFV62_11560, partial [Pseudomonadota bacterium]
KPFVAEEETAAEAGHASHLLQAIRGGVVDALETAGRNGLRRSRRCHDRSRFETDTAADTVRTLDEALAELEAASDGSHPEPETVDQRDFVQLIQAMGVDAARLRLAIADDALDLELLSHTAATLFALSRSCDHLAQTSDAVPQAASEHLVEAAETVMRCANTLAQNAASARPYPFHRHFAVIEKGGGIKSLCFARNRQHVVCLDNGEAPQTILRTNGSYVKPKALSAGYRDYFSVALNFEGFLDPLELGDIDETQNQEVHAVSPDGGKHPFVLKKILSKTAIRGMTRALPHELLPNGAYLAALTPDSRHLVTDLLMHPLNDRSGKTLGFISPRAFYADRGYLVLPLESIYNYLDSSAYGAFFVPIFMRLLKK